MNNDKICFITCVNDERLYEECLVYINSLDIPKNFSIETVALRGADSIASAYNKAMRETDSKYKVYLHQDAFIINKNFIYDILEIFKKKYRCRNDWCSWSKRYTCEWNLVGF